MQSTQYKLLTESFTQWLEIIGYAETTVYCSPRYVERFLEYAENKGCKEITDIDNKLIKSYFEYLSTRKNKVRGGGLSQNYMRGNLNALKRFSKYLRDSRNENLDIPIEIPQKTPEKEILTKAEIRALYKATEETILGYRDKAMLAIYYGCGLRRSEGIALNVRDIMFSQQKIYVIKGKNYRERYVPITPEIAKDLKAYIENARPYLLKNLTEHALFLSMRGKRINSQSMLIRIKKLTELAEITKEIGFHSLRHSIATHLLQSGMPLE